MDLRGESSDPNSLIQALIFGGMKKSRSEYPESSCSFLRRERVFNASGSASE